MTFKHTRIIIRVCSTAFQTQLRGVCHGSSRPAVGTAPRSHTAPRRPTAGRKDDAPARNRERGGRAGGLRRAGCPGSLAARLLGTPGATGRGDGHAGGSWGAPAGRGGTPVSAYIGPARRTARGGKAAGGDLLCVGAAEGEKVCQASKEDMIGRLDANVEEAEDTAQNQSPGPMTHAGTMRPAWVQFAVA